MARRRRIPQRGIMTLTPLLDLLFVMIFVALLKTDAMPVKAGTPDRVDAEKARERREGPSLKEQLQEAQEKIAALEKEADPQDPALREAFYKIFAVNEYHADAASGAYEFVGQFLIAKDRSGEFWQFRLVGSDSGGAVSSAPQDVHDPRLCAGFTVSPEHLERVCETETGTKTFEFDRVDNDTYEGFMTAEAANGAVSARNRVKMEIVEIYDPAYSL